MATDYTAIIDAIDAAIIAGVDKPGTISHADGRSVAYRNLKDLTDARKHYVGLQNAANRPRKGFKLTKFRAK